MNRSDDDAHLAALFVFCALLLLAIKLCGGLR